jgi:hypothetical protein
MKSNCRRGLGTVTLVALACVATPAAQEPGLSGRWTIDRAQSQFPADVGFNAPFIADVPGTPAPGRGRGRSRQSSPRAPLLPESQDDANRLQQLTAEVRTPPVNLLVVDTPSAITITDERERSRTFHPTGREDIVQLDNVPAATVATRTAGRLVVTYKVEDGRDLRYMYSASTNPPQLVVETIFVERGVAADTVRRVYVPGTAAIEPPSPPTNSTAASNAANAAPQASTPAGPDAELKGLTKLGVVVEDLSAQAAACGLKSAPIEEALTKSFTDAGLTVVRSVSSNDNTYLYVNIVTTRASADLCVSKYDASLYTHTTTKLPYGSAPVPVQVLLLHNGGLAGGAAATHGDNVLKGLKEYVDQFASRIRAANPR